MKKLSAKYFCLYFYIGCTNILAEHNGDKDTVTQMNGELIVELQVFFYACVIGGWFDHIFNFLYFRFDP